MIGGKIMGNMTAKKILAIGLLVVGIYYGYQAYKDYTEKSRAQAQILTQMVSIPVIYTAENMGAPIPLQKWTPVSSVIEERTNFFGTIAKDWRCRCVGNTFEYEGKNVFKDVDLSDYEKTFNANRSNPPIKMTQKEDKLNIYIDGKFGSVPFECEK